MLYHIAHKSDWDMAQENGAYIVESLHTEGFIHLSTAAQIVKTANNYYQGVADLVVLAIDDAALAAERLKYEPAPYPPYEPYPHYYASLPTDTVRQVVAYSAEKNGTYQWPQGLPQE